MIRQLWRGHLEVSGGPAEIEVLIFGLVRDGVYSRVEIFEGTDVDAALARFEEIGAQTQPERVFVRACRSANSRDWDALADLYADDYGSIDHRVLGWEPARGGRSVADFFRSWAELVPDGELRFTVLAGDDEHAVVRWVGCGHAAEGGGEIEYAITQTVSVRDGRIRQAETFDPDDETPALARFQELRADRR